MICKTSTTYGSVGLVKNRVLVLPVAYSCFQKLARPTCQLLPYGAVEALVLRILQIMKCIGWWVIDVLRMRMLVRGISKCGRKTEKTCLYPLTALANR